MSLILEALRKSEAERQRGRAPGLFVEQVATRPKDRASMPAWAWLLGALLLATLAFLTWQLQRGQVPNPVPDQGQGQVANLEPAPVPSAAEPAAPAAAIDPALPGSSSTSVPATPNTSVAVAAPAQAPAPDRAPPPTTVATPLESTPIAAPAPEPTPTPTDRGQVPNLTPLESLPTLANLDAGTRAQLPPLKLSMHVFAEAPAQRFVILDGQRLGEGASPAAGIVLEEIRREGLVISVNGQCLLLARP